MRSVSCNNEDGGGGGDDDDDIDCVVATVELEQSRDEQQTTRYRVDELDRNCRNLEAEKETLKSTIESMERAVEQKELKIERALKDLVSLKEDMDRRLFDKDEELQNMR